MTGMNIWERWRDDWWDIGRGWWQKPPHRAKKEKEERKAIKGMMKNEEEEEGTNLVQGMDKHTWSHSYLQAETSKLRVGEEWIRRWELVGFRRGCLAFIYETRKRWRILQRNRRVHKDTHTWLPVEASLDSLLTEVEWLIKEGADLILVWPLESFSATHGRRREPPTLH